MISCHDLYPNSVHNGENIFGVHFHCAKAGKSGPAVVIFYGANSIDKDGIFKEGEITNNDIGTTDCLGLEINNLASLYQSMREGSIYFDVHTDKHVKGEIRTQIFTL